MGKLAETDPDLAPMPALVNPFIELGKLKGREEGRAIGERSLVLRQLER